MVFSRATSRKASLLSSPVKVESRCWAARRSDSRPLAQPISRTSLSGPQSGPISFIMCCIGMIIEVRTLRS